MFKSTPVSFRNVDITGGFLAAKQKLNREVTVYSVQNRFEDTGRFEAFKFNWKEGADVPKPHFFWDSDVAKWLEAVFFIYAKSKDEKLMEKAESVIDLIEKNQCADGYFNIFHTVVEPQNRFKIRDHHELYCLGHLIEAAAAYYETTGNKRFIDILDRYIDLVIKAFVTEKTAGFTTPGHEEIELALVKLYRVTGCKKYLDLAKFFIDNRGSSPEDVLDWMNSKYLQSDIPVRLQREAEGHAVRACYLYSGMADVAGSTDDGELLEACKALFDDITEKKMYITGGIGSTHHGEAFTIPYDLPNDTAYNETCASIALAMFANRMKDIDFDSKYADIVELEMYNGALAGLSLDGKAFFYENPLEINLADRTRHISVNKDDRLPITERKEVFSCSCCPPNVTRYIASLADSFFSKSENAIYIHQFAELTAEIDGAAVTMETNYPNSGTVNINIANAGGKQIYIRLPGWCRKHTVSKNYTLENGYMRFEADGDVFEVCIEFDISPVFRYASPLVRADAGKTAITAGPVVYCAEAVDNNYSLFDLVIDTEAETEIRYDEQFGINTVTAKGYVTESGEYGIYRDKKELPKTEVEVKLIPYCAYANRGESDMRVWIRY